MAISTESTAPETRAEIHPAGRATFLVAWVLTLAIAALAILPMAVATVGDGRLLDNDDAMRLVQMREWMGGKNWFDVTERRVNPPEGMTSHWPRLIELPMVGGTLALSAIVDRDLAERIVIAAWPCVLLALLMLVLLAIAARLFSPPTLLAAAAILGLNPLLQFQSLPGRIDHHGVQLVLCAVLALETIRAIADGRLRAAVFAGLAAALSIAIGLETVLLVAVAVALFGGAWIVIGAPSRRVVTGFGASFALATPLLFALSVSPTRWTVAAADALSLPWLWLAVAGGLGLAGLASLHIGSWKRRVVWATAAAALVCGVFVVLWPHVLAGPLADVDPLVRELWLDGVGEARPLASLVAERPGDFLYFLVFPTFGWLGLAVAARRETAMRPAFLILLAFASIALVMAIGAMRGAPLAALFCIFGWLYAIDRALGGFGQGGALSGMLIRGIGVLVLLVATLPSPWSALGNAVKASPSSDNAATQNCGVRADMAALAAEPPGLVLAPLRLGPRILVATKDDVVAAPYHRNNRGNRFALETLTADPATAHAAIKKRGVSYVALCLGDPDLPRLTAYAKNSLLQSLVDGAAPSWLAPLPPHGPIRAWRVVD